MSGHNKWSSIKHKKGAADKKRAKIFSKVIREITVAVKQGGASAESNPTLRQAMLLAKSVNMPSDTIQKTIKRADGDTDTTNYESIVYEGIAPHNIAVIIECLTDNKNRTIANIRSIFNKKGGTLGSNNSVQHLFQEVGLLKISKDKVDEEQLTECILEAGAEDYQEKEDFFEIYTEPKKLHLVHSQLEKKFSILESELCFIPHNPIEVDNLEKASKVIDFLENLEDEEDVQKVHSNFSPTKQILAQMENSES